MSMMYMPSSKDRHPTKNENGRIEWHFEKNGVFTIKSAYRLALELKQDKRPSTSSNKVPNGERSIWNNIWKVNVQPKIRVFGWRVAADSLATKKNKWRRTL
jgi:hypothetical protein